MKTKYDVGDEVFIKGKVTKIVHYRKDEKPLYSINRSDANKEGFYFQEKDIIGPVHSPERIDGIACKRDPDYLPLIISIIALAASFLKR